MNLFSFVFVCILITSRVNGEDYSIFTPCNMEDDGCLMTLFNVIGDQLATTGFPEIGISKIDPLEIDNVTMTFLESIHLTISPAIIEKLKTCRYERAHIDPQKETIDLDWVCDAALRGNFTLAGSNPLFEGFLGTSNIDGGGHVILTTEKLRFDLVFPFKISKNESNHYINLKDPKFTFDVKNVNLKAKDVFIAGQNFTQFMNEYFNSNWKYVIQNFGKTLFSKHLDIYLSILRKVLASIPASNFIKDDLSIYESD